MVAVIGGLVDLRVIPLWTLYVWGGTSTTQDLTRSFAPDFTGDPNTADATSFLVEALRADLTARPPTFPPGTAQVPVPLSSRIPAQLAEIDNPAGPNGLAFAGLNIPGNLAGGIGKTQHACQVGARPSLIDDLRQASGSALVTDNRDGTLTVEPSITFLVRDTIDFCPGNCGTGLALGATVPFSIWEASGISGDVPFEVRFPAPAARTTPIRITPARAPPPPPVVVPTNVLFRYNRDVLEPTEEGGDPKEVLRRLLPRVQASPSTDIVGHADARGSQAYNLPLSQRRAEAVKKFFEDEDPSLRGRLRAEGRGKSDLLVENATTDEEHARNRRVELAFGEGPGR